MLYFQLPFDLTLRANQADTFKTGMKTRRYYFSSLEELAVCSISGGGVELIRFDRTVVKQSPNIFGCNV